jgi:hypothetical protein
MSCNLVKVNRRSKGTSCVAWPALRPCWWKLLRNVDCFGDISEALNVAPSSIPEALYNGPFWVFMACETYSLEQRVFIYDCYVKTNWYKSCRRKFPRKFPDKSTSLPSGDTIPKLEKRVGNHGILFDKRPLKRYRVLTDEKPDSMGHQLEHSPGNLCGDWHNTLLFP